MLKWPNDLLLGGDQRKAAGILAEVIPAGPAVVVGIGVGIAASATVSIVTGGLVGTVKGIAADTDIGRNEEQFYRVIVSTDKTWLGDQPGLYPITPGMLGEVDIKVDTQMILWSLLRPVLKLKTEALREI